MPYVHVAQALGIFTTSFAAGWGYSISQGTTSILSVLNSSAPATVTEKDVSAAVQHSQAQWEDLFSTGKKTGPSLAVLGSTHLAYVAYQVYYHPNIVLGHWKSYAYAAAFHIAIVPFTFLVMKPTNDALHRIGTTVRSLSTDAGAAAERDELQGLLKKWIRFNTIRAVFPLVAAIIALSASLP